MIRPQPTKTEGDVMTVIITTQSQTPIYNQSYNKHVKFTSYRDPFTCRFSYVAAMTTGTRTRPYTFFT